MGVERHAAAFEPVGFGIGADEQEHVAYRMFLFGAVLVIAPGHRAKSCPPVAVQLRQLGVGSSSMFGVAAMRSIRYRDMLAARLGPAYQHDDLCGCSREEHRGLTGRIAATDQDHFGALRTFSLQAPKPNTTRRGLRTRSRRGTAGRR